jgi:hypothetical protein
MLFCTTTVRGGKISPMPAQIARDQARNRSRDCCHSDCKMNNRVLAQFSALSDN